MACAPSRSLLSRQTAINAYNRVAEREFRIRPVRIDGRTSLVARFDLIKVRSCLLALV